MLYSVNKEENFPNCPFPLGFRRPAGKDRAKEEHAQKFGEGSAYGSGDIFAEKQTIIHKHTLTHTQTYSSLYFTTAPVSEVIIVKEFVFVLCLL